MKEWPGAEILEAALVERGSSRRLALALGTDPSNVTRWKRGAWPDPSMWPQIEEALGLPSGTLTRSTGGVSAAGIEELRERLDQVEATLAQLLERLPAPAEPATVVPMRRAARGAAGTPSKDTGRPASRPHPPVTD